jgi:xanthine dehydrogenase accessory factor
MQSIWNNIQAELEAEHHLLLMIVLESEGSSPGRQGFKMFVSSSGAIVGSIGGGIMEHKLVELCKNKLLQSPTKPFMKRQIHQANIGENRSGMICSGLQAVAFYPLNQNDLPTISEILKAGPTDRPGVLIANDTGLHFERKEKITSRFLLDLPSSDSWSLKENVVFQNSLHIIGGGHVSLALSNIASFAGFDVTVYDNRKDLNTIKQNVFAHFVHLRNYKNIKQSLLVGEGDYVVIMSFGHRSDMRILKQLLDSPYQYLGMMGSKVKVNQIFQDLIKEGVSPDQLEKVHAPIGIPISSRTPEEIAVSIMAEIIKVKNQSKSD